MFCKFHWKTTALESLYLKKAPTQVFFNEFCEIFKKTSFVEHLQTTASVCLKNQDLWGPDTHRGRALEDSSEFLAIHFIL